jgi:prephenate dehydrogenase
VSADGSDFTACIIGVGLMGGSLALAWRAAGWPAQVVGVDRDQKALDAALACGAIDRGDENLAGAVTGADVIVLATPVRSILHLLAEVGRYARPGALVMDLGSSKTRICVAMADLPDYLEAVGGHPMCGKEREGFGAAEAGLFRGRPFVLCPLPQTSAAAVERAKKLVEVTGARPVIAAPEAHDRAVAAISHLPYMTAVALARAVERQGGPLAQSLAATGFRDTTRVAASDVDVMLDALLTNREAVLDWIGAFEAELAALRSALDAGNEAGLRAQLEAACEWRRKLMLDKNAVV